MIISPNLIIGSLVYKTLKEILKDGKITKQILSYPLADKLCTDGIPDLRHYLLAPGEAENALNFHEEDHKSPALSFPAVITMQPVQQKKTPLENILSYELAFTVPIRTEWNTAKIESEAFVKVLHPIYEQFMKQVRESGYFQLDFGTPSHLYYEVYTDYGKFEDLLLVLKSDTARIEIKQLELKTKDCLPDSVIKRMEEESSLVTPNY